MGSGNLKTKDLFLSAYLLSCDINLKNMGIEKGGRVFFSFTGSDRLDRLNKDDREGKATCNALRLKESLQYLRDQMFTLLRR